MTKLELLALKHELGADKVFVQPPSQIPTPTSTALIFSFGSLQIGVSSFSMGGPSRVALNVKFCKSIGLGTTGIDTTGWEEL